MKRSQRLDVVQQAAARTEKERAERVALAEKHLVEMQQKLAALEKYRGEYEAEFAANIERLIKDGATGVVAGGCTGEFWALSHDERKRLYEVSKEAVAGKGTLIVGTGAVTVDEAVALSPDGTTGTFVDVNGTVSW